MKHHPDVDQRLTRFGELHQSINLNLMATSERERISVHIEEVRQLATLLGQGHRRIVDVGSGGGLPGLVLAALEVAEEVHLIESVLRKARFLETAAAELGIERTVTVHAARSEECTQAGGPLRECCDIAIARALAAPVVALELLAPAVRLGGEVVYMTTRAAVADISPLSVAADSLGLGHPRVVPFPTSLREDGALLRAIREEPTPARFPRRAGLARTRPLA